MKSYLEDLLPKFNQKDYSRDMRIDTWMKITLEGRLNMNIDCRIGA